MFEIKKLSIVMVIIGLSLIVLNTHESNAQGAKVKGRVVNLFGDALIGAKVTILAEDGQEIRETEVNEKGEYQIDEIRTRRFLITASLSGFRLEKKHICLTSDKVAVVDFGLEIGQLFNSPPTEVKGTVFDLHEKPLNDVTVVFTNAFNSRITLTVVTNEAGKYSLETTNEGQYIITFYKTGFLLGAKRVLLDGKKSVSININLQKRR